MTPPGRRTGTRARRGTDHGGPRASRGGPRASRGGGRRANGPGSADGICCAMANHAAALHSPPSGGEVVRADSAGHRLPAPAQAPRRSSPQVAPVPPGPGPGAAPRLAQHARPLPPRPAAGGGLRAPPHPRSRPRLIFSAALGRSGTRQPPPIFPPPLGGCAPGRPGRHPERRSPRHPGTAT